MGQLGELPCPGQGKLDWKQEMEEWERPGMRGTVLSSGFRPESGRGTSKPMPSHKEVYKD